MVDYWTRLEPELKAKNIPPAELARLMKISYQAVKKVMNGGSFGTKNNSKVAALLDLNSDWLATGKGQKYVIDVKAKWIEENDAMKAKIIPIESAKPYPLALTLEEIGRLDQVALASINASLLAFAVAQGIRTQATSQPALETKQV